MFADLRLKKEQQEYVLLLKAVASLSKLYSDSSVPYLGYRAVENIFCRAFGAENLSRSDISIDAKKGKIGIGIKTFINRSGNSFQKIAEFNKDREKYSSTKDKETIKIVSRLRNSRLEAAKRIYNLHQMIYHCAARSENRILIFETPMVEVNIPLIRNINRSGNIIYFNDKINDYKFNLSKSTLFKRFITKDVLFNIDTKLLKDPYQALIGLYNNLTKEELEEKAKSKYSYVVLPLYSKRRSSKSKYVPPKSGLNQWNAAGRTRDFDEVYIQIPKWIHKIFPDFFPPRNTNFKIKLPNGRVINAKVCQDNGKALMSNPNKALGQWILREVLELPKGKLLDYTMLEEIGVDSVIIYKYDGGEYEIDFGELGTYDEFLEEYKK